MPSYYFPIPSQSRHEENIKLFKVFISCVCVIMFFTICLDWNITDADRSLRVRINSFYSRYPKSSQGADPFDILTTERRLAHFYPYESWSKEKQPYPIPKNIWQMWKTSDIPEKYKEPNNRMIELNPEFKHHFQTNDEIIQTVIEEFKDTVPEVAEALELLPSLILKADYSRYILLFLYGGSYSDIDVQFNVPIVDWFDTNRNVGFVCGTEMDINEESWDRMPRRQEVQNGFFKSKPRHVILRKIIATIVKNTFLAIEKGTEASYSGQPKCSALHIMDWTGPGLFTDVIYAHFNSLKNPVIIDTKVRNWRGGDPLYGPNVTNGVGISWKATTGMNWPIIIDDIVLYPQHTLRDRPRDDGRDFYVTHLFMGSWKTDG